ncbi:AGE family epimerase/isomerase [Embleya sp. NPDC127516]|uniref:AGE family epimerase/isomerase n=1 Tax=Embleya sp. NPDC127516 TaxID=3363990 RepID=UPI003806A8AA
MAAEPLGDSPEHVAWLDAECDRLIRFARGSRLAEGGFGWLDDVGRPVADGVVHTWVTARMTHVFALAQLRRDGGAGVGEAGGVAAGPSAERFAADGFADGFVSGPLGSGPFGGRSFGDGPPGGTAGGGDVDAREAAGLVAHGLAALTELLHDHEHGGWHPVVTRSGRPVLDAERLDGKRMYDHAFVVLAAASASAAGHRDASALLAEALDLVELRFWEADRGACAESWDRTWTTGEPYRGANSNMHAVEAFLAAADATGEHKWRTRALRIAERVVHDHARANRWRLIEHFDPDWTPRREYHRERPADPFRPYGATVGHWFEWSRLLLSLADSLPDPPGWLRADAVDLFAAAVREGGHADGRPGFVYTLDWAGQPVVRTRMHWVLAEAITAAAALRRATGVADYDDWYRAWWEHADAVFLDREHGSWHHELDADTRPSATVWQGKPDAYHAVQATLLPRLRSAPTIAEALRRATR